MGEMAEKIRESITIDDAELRRLAQELVKTVKDFILQDIRYSEDTSETIVQKQTSLQFMKQVLIGCR